MGSTLVMLNVLVIALPIETIRAEEARRPTETGATGKTLKVITYNVQFLPGLARLINKRKDPEYRARTIGKALADFDVVGLNELFDERPRKILLDEFRRAWGDDFNVVLSPKPDHRFSGGCAIVSRLPFIETHGMIYSAASDPKDYGLAADGHAAKGAIHARIRRGGTDAKPDVIDVFATHLESKSQAARHVQYKELAEFVRKHSDPSHPVLILGDLNTRGNPEYMQRPKSQYNVMMRIFRQARPGAKLTDVWPHLKSTNGGTSRQTAPDGGRRIDYVLLSNPAGDSHRLRPVGVRVNHFLDPRVVALSDHSAVEAEFR